MFPFLLTIVGMHSNFSRQSMTLIYHDIFSQIYSEFFLTPNHSIIGQCLWWYPCSIWIFSQTRNQCKTYAYNYRIMTHGDAFCRSTTNNQSQSCILDSYRISLRQPYQLLDHKCESPQPSPPILRNLLTEIYLTPGKKHLFPPVPIFRTLWCFKLAAHFTRSHY